MAKTPFPGGKTPRAVHWLLTLKAGRTSQTPIAPMSLIECLERFCKTECSDPRDKIFGLMGLVDERERI